MTRYAAFLRGVNPMNAKMPELKACLEAAGFTGVRTLLSSGNVVFDARPASIASLQRRVEAAMRNGLGHAFLTLVRPVEDLVRLIDEDPFRGFPFPTGAKRMVTFLRAPRREKPGEPLEMHGSRVLAERESEVFSLYMPGRRGSAFLARLEKALGKDVTTRTWDTVRKCASA